MEKDIEFLTTRAKEWDVRANQDIATELVQKLEDKLDTNKDLVFTVSQEVGNTERAVDIRFADDTYIFMNPIFQKADRLKLCREFDRIKEKEFIVPRFSNVEVVFQDCLGAVKATKLEDVAAMVMHQAIDMLDGVYPGDIGLEILPEFDQATPEEQQEVIEVYLSKYLKDMYNELDADLLANDETRDQWNSIKFMAAKSRGEVKTEEEPVPLSNRKKKFINKLSKQLNASKNKMKFWRNKK